MTHIPERLLIQAHLAARQPCVLSEQESAEHHTAIVAELKAQNAVLVTHCYRDPVIQASAEETGSCVSGPLEMARLGNQHLAQTVVAAGVRFMDETAKILNPERRVLMPTLEATYSLDLGCLVDELSVFCDQYPERTVVVYADASATVKTHADWVVTFSRVVEIVEHLMDNDGPILQTPDQHPGRCIQRETGADILLWDGAHIVHEEFKAKQLEDTRAFYLGAAILAHPESSENVVALTDTVGPTSQLIKAAQTLPNKTFIVTTDRGIFYKMQQLCPDKDLIEVPTVGDGAVHRSCAHCPRMVVNTLERTLACLREGSGEIFVDSALIPWAVRPLKCTLDFTQAAHLRRVRNA